MPRCTRDFAVYLLLAIFCFSHIHQGSLAVDAIRYSSISWQILETGDWIHLIDSYSGAPYANKPPLLFWLLALTFKLVGYSTFSAKLIPSIFTFLAVLLLYRVTLRFGTVAALWAVLLFLFNRSFMREINDVGFDGMAALGIVIIIRSFMDLVDSKLKYQFSEGFVCALGIFLVAQSKPPYLLFMVVPALYLLYREKALIFAHFRFSFLAGAILPLFLAISWFVYAGASYRDAAYSNQVGKSLMYDNGWLDNLLTWFHSYFVTTAPASWAALAALCTLARRRALFSKIGTRERFLLLWFAQTALIVLFVACRPRYLWVTLLPGVLLGAIYLQDVLPRVGEKGLRNICFAISSIIVIALLSGVQFHKTNQVITALRSVERELKTSRSIREVCFDHPESAIKGERYRRETKLLVKLETGRDVRFVSSSDAWSSRGPLLANMACNRRLLEYGFQSRPAETKNMFIAEAPQP